MVDYATASTNSNNLAYFMDEPLYAAIYDKYNSNGSPMLDADQDGIITIAEAAGWGGAVIQLNAQGLTGTLRGLDKFTSPSLQTIRIDGNSFTGAIPPELGNLTSLTEINLNGNPFIVSTIPSELGNLVNLTVLRLGVSLTGTIPASLCNLTQLVSLSAAINSTDRAGQGLSGEIPACLGSISSLREINLAINNFSGTVPAEWVNLPLTDIRLNRNPNLVTPAKSPLWGNYSNWLTDGLTNNLNITSVGAHYATVSPQDGALMTLNQDLDGDGKADINFVHSATLNIPEWNIDSNGDNKANLNVMVFPEEHTFVFNAAAPITISDGFAGWIPNNYSLAPGTWTKADFRVSADYPYYLEAVTPGALVLNGNPAPVILTITECDTNNDVNGDGVPDYNIDVNSDGVVDWRPFDICPGVPSSGLFGGQIEGAVISALSVIAGGAVIVAVWAGRKLMARRR